MSHYYRLENNVEIAPIAAVVVAEEDAALGVGNIVVI